jgi:hypothetical protein
MSAAANPAPPPPTITTEVGRAFGFEEDFEEEFEEKFEEKFEEEFDEMPAVFAAG